MARTPPRTTLALNLRYLMDRRGWTQETVAKKSGVSQKTVSNVLNQKKVSGLEVIDSIAQCFGLDSWDLIRPTLVVEMEGGGHFKQLHDFYFKASSKGQDFILGVAEREADYQTRGNNG